MVTTTELSPVDDSNKAQDNTWMSTIIKAYTFTKKHPKTALATAALGAFILYNAPFTLLVVGGATYGALLYSPKTVKPFFDGMSEEYWKLLKSQFSTRTLAIGGVALTVIFPTAVCVYGSVALGRIALAIDEIKA